MRGIVFALVTCATAIPYRLLAQSALLSALEGSVPAPVAGSTTGAWSAGLPGLWLDPTSAPRATGAFFSFYQSSYASVQVYHAAVAFRLGPRWLLTYGQSDIPNLFDSSLTNADPTLSSLQARALWGGLDATGTIGSLAGSVGLALAEDDNVGDFHSSTVARVALRVSPFPWGSAGLRVARGVGGSLSAEPAGRVQLDAAASRNLGDVTVSLGAGVVRGALWRYAETKNGFGFAAVVTVASRLSLGVGAARYATGFGATSYEWDRSAVAALRVSTVHLGVRYTSTRLGVGSGYGISIGYEAHSSISTP